MKRLLIVDDEKIEREGIKMLLKTMEIELEILEANNGKKALQILKERKIDLLLTDIKMPFMTGLELTRAARELRPELQIAIFSGFGEFTYAQEAIKYGVTNYILKPVKPQEFCSTIEMMLRSSERIEQEKEQKMSSSSFLNKYLFQKFLFTGKKEYLERMLQMQSREATALKVQNMMLLEADNNFFEDNSGELVGRLEQKLGRKLEYLDLNTNQLLLVFYQSASDNYGRIAAYIQEYILQEFGADCYIAVSSRIERPEQCPAACQELENLMENKFYRPDMKIYLPEEQTANPREGHRIDYQKKLKDDIKLRDVAHLWRDYEMLREQISRECMDSQMYVKFIYAEIVKDLYEEMQMQNREWMKEAVEEIYQAGNLDDICRVVSRCIHEFENSNLQSEKNVRSDVDTVKQYIHYHLEEELGIDRLSQIVFLSPGYLSYVFKKETGVNLSRYIKDCRMEKAKELLSKTNMKVVQICEKVGFTNPSYFCQSFREYCGVSPDKYRKGEGEDEKLAL